MLLITILFCILMLAMTFIEYHQYKTLLTPFTVMVWPYVFIVLFLLMFGWHRQYYPISGESIAFVTVNVAVFWLTGQIMWFILRGQQSREANPQLEDFIAAHRTIFLAIVWIAIAAGLLSFIKTGFIFGFNSLGTESFQLAFRSGILGHITIMAYPSFILLGAYWLKNRGRILFVSLLLLILIVLANQVKYRTILLILPTIYFSIQSKIVKKIKAINIIGIGLMIFAIFILAYFIGFSATLGFNQAFRLLSFTFSAFEDYIVGGPISLGYFLKSYENYLSSNIVFTAPLNVIHFISGDFNYINPAIPFFVPIASQFAVKNNTGTMFTTLFMCLGFYGSLIFMMVIGLGIYSIYNRALTKRGTVINLLSAHLLGILTVSFFGYHFHLLPLWEAGLSMIITPYTALAIKKVFHLKSR
jgi:hypothetical protein